MNGILIILILSVVLVLMGMLTIKSKDTLLIQFVSRGAVLIGTMNIVVIVIFAIGGKL